MATQKDKEANTRFNNIKFIRMNAHANLQFGELLGNAKLEIFGTGGMIMLFGQDTGDRWPIRILGVDLAWKSFTLPLPEGKSTIVDGFHVSNSDFSLEESYGLLNPKTGEVSLHLEIRLRPENIPQLRLLGVSETLNVTVVEEGTMNYEEGRILQTHAKTFQIPSNLPEGLISVYAGQCSPNATGTLLGILAEGHSPEELVDLGGSELFICPGKKVFLGWRISDFPEASEAEITAPGISAIPVDSAEGFVEVFPEETTTYTLSVTDNEDCTFETSVTVMVVKEGSTVDMQAAREINQPVWKLTFPPALVDPDILVTSIQSSLCIAYRCVIKNWNCRKVDENGSVHGFLVTNPAQPLNPVPLAGNWGFEPIRDSQFLCAPDVDPLEQVPDPFGLPLACFLGTLDCKQ